MTEINIEHLRAWIGRGESAADRVTPVPVAALRATLDQEPGVPQAGEMLPPLWHWLYFLPLHRQSELAPNGHSRMGGFMPPIPLSRRMYAGGSLKFHRALRIGDDITRVSTITDISLRQGRSGPLIFLKITHAISNQRGLAVTEEQDIVYRQDAGPGAHSQPGQAAPGNQGWQRELSADPIMLFRFSALTFNGHRIHYDHPYVTTEEGYPGLLVHGPLLAILMLDLVQQQLPDGKVLEYRFRAVRPVFATAPFYLCGAPDAGDDRQIRLWVKDAEHVLCFEATAILES